MENVGMTKCKQEIQVCDTNTAYMTVKNTYTQQQSNETHNYKMSTKLRTYEMHARNFITAITSDTEQAVERHDNILSGFSVSHRSRRVRQSIGPHSEAQGFVSPVPYIVDGAACTR